MRRLWILLPALTALTVLEPVAGQTLVAPNGYATAEGNTNNFYPWLLFSSTPNLRVQQIYDSTHFTNQGIVGPTLISQLRYRADGGTGSWAGATWPNVTISMSTAATDYLSASLTYAQNHGPDLRTVLNGAVVVSAGSASTPGPWYVTIPLSTPFVYDPSTGRDLVVDLQISGGMTGVSFAVDHVSAAGSPPPLGTRLLNSSSSSAAVAGSRDLNYCAVTEFTCGPAVGLFAAFTATPPNGPSPLAVQFTDQSFTSDPGGVTSWAWDLDGDNVTDSTLPNPAFVYTNCGSYDVRLTITDATHAPTTLLRTAYIVTDLVTPSFTHVYLGATQVMFLDTTTPPATTWAWDLDGDNIVDATTPTIVWNYPNPREVVNASLTASRLCAPAATVTRAVGTSPSLATPLAGGSTIATSGAGNLFDLTVTNALGINVTALTMRPNSNPVIPANTPLTVDVWITSAAGGHSANHTNAAVWRLVATGNGVFSSNGTPILMPLAQPFHLTPGTYGVALHMNGCGLLYSNIPLTTFSNADVSLSPGMAKTGPFVATSTASRTWNGILWYDPPPIVGTGGYGYFAAGCPGSAGIPSNQASALPILGQSMVANIGNLPTPAAAFFLFGFSNTTSPLGPLPLDLGAFGAPGCMARVSVDANVLIFGASGTASLSWSVPNNAGFLGLRLFTQALVLDTPANGLGATTSDAAALILGT